MGIFDNNIAGTGSFCPCPPLTTYDVNNIAYIGAYNTGDVSAQAINASGVAAVQIRTFPNFQLFDCC